MTTKEEINEQASKRNSPTGAKTDTPTESTDSGSITGSTSDGRTCKDLSATGRTAAGGMIKEAKRYLFECDRNARYHIARKSFFDLWHRWMMVAVLFSSSYAVFELSNSPDSDILPKLIMLIPAIIGAVNVGIDITNRAYNHGILSHRFYEIAKSIDLEDVDQINLEQWRRAILNVYMDEPGVYHALNAECYNAAAQARGVKERQKISFFHHFLRHWCKFSAKDFPQCDKSTG